VSATLVSCHQPHRDLPSIPLDLAELRRLEQKGRTDFEWIKLTFNGLNGMSLTACGSYYHSLSVDAENFRSEYLSLKKRWDDERRAQGIDLVS
jgi:hypothetical protein